MSPAKRTREATLVFPHQLFERHPAISKGATVLMIEDALFFGDRHHPTRFHQQKLWLHRATMSHYQQRLEKKGFPVSLFAYENEHAETAPLERAFQMLSDDGIEMVRTTEPHDYLLTRRLRRFARRHDIELSIVETPMFLNSREANEDYRSGRKRWFMADFYQFQRKRLDVLMNGEEPVGERWSFDEDNRKKVPKKMLGSIPKLEYATHDDVDRRARDSVLQQFPDHPGSLDELIYPTTHAKSKHWLKRFLEQRFELFGDYEDAIVQNESWLWHAVLTPMLNVGLLTPQQILDAAVEHAAENDIPLNSAEGFIRQIIGWREFIRATYDDLGVRMRHGNHWNHHRGLPDSFWEATTGIDPIDDCIGRIKQTAYCHHIERLMVLGGFMFLCEFDPDDIYRWFMEMFIDSYDWVMVPNAYAMSQNADGGLITTKPYFSGSAYVKKMSHFKHGPWADVWDGLYWRWIWNHRKELGKNPRWAMMCRSVERMDDDKRRTHLKNAEDFLAKLDAENAKGRKYAVAG